MLNASTLASKLGMLPDPKTVTVTLQNRSTAVTLTIDGCRRRPVDLRDVSLLGNVGMGVPSAQFLIPASGMGTHDLQPGDVITEEAGNAAGETAYWNVIHAVLEMQGTIWRAYVAKRG